MKTNAVRLLEELKIPHELRNYEVDPNDLSAETVAEKIGLPAEQVFKTLVVKGERGEVSLAVIPGDTELDLKSFAALSGNRKVELAPLKEVQPLTGYIRGGVTALAAKKKIPRLCRRNGHSFRPHLHFRRRARNPDPALAGRLHSCHPGNNRRDLPPQDLILRARFRPK